MIVSLVKEALKASSTTYFEKIYGASKGNRPFSFGIYLHNYEMKEDVFQVNGYVGLTLSSPDPEFMLHFYNGLMSMKEFRYKEFSLLRTKINMVTTPSIDSTSVYLKTLSPLLICDKQTKPVSIHEEAFEKELNYISNVVLKDLRGTGLIQPLQFTSKKMKKVVVKENIHSDEETLFFTAYQGVFVLSGHPEDLKFLSETGLGFRSSQGFGAVEVM